MDISINGLLSIYNLVFKTCITYTVASCVGQLQWSWFSADRRLLYDAVRYHEAAVGWWGSFQLLRTQGWKHPLAALGAFILIATVVVDPFIQQLVVPVDCSAVVSGENATVPRTNMVGNEAY